MAKLKKKMKDVTGDGKFTFADVLKMRGVKPKGEKKSMEVGGRLGYYTKPMAPFYVGNPLTTNKSVRLTADYLDRIDDAYGPYRGADRGIDQYSGKFKSIDVVGNRAKDMALADREYVGGLKEQPFIERKSDILRERGLMDPMRYDIPEDMEPLKPRKPGEIMGYGGRVRLKSQGKGGVVEYGLGGMLTKGLNEIIQGNGLGAAVAAGAKGLATPGSGIGGAAQLAGNLAQKSNNPMLQNIGKMAGVASNFLPGGNPMGAIGALKGLFKQEHGGYVSPKHRLR